jgi:hypothetical protein
MRRPNMLRFNKWINECLESVANNPRATKLDIFLVHWVRVTKIQDELGQSLSFDDPSNMANLAEPMVQLKVTGFEKTLEAWKKAAEFEVNGTIPMIFRTPLTNSTRYTNVTIPPYPNVPPRNRHARRAPT